ncbi:phytanoyl-CoA dioxygenase family protein [Pseudomonas hormoni]|uniref:Phytanoyl-CoA dioxygenase family protein n=1 Tax=Pseudomonas hormoni TaxID=3093767 RepID=A0ABX8EV86_9PSED|nr:phytanoyl-CoA dioxygenase family protein [Pseudomonas hormoni]QVW22178.1 phytanoyl-CoA dioxygenase family protein [Pseudomonas hormoni]
MTTKNNPPQSAYGILERVVTTTHADEVVEQVQNVGYAIFEAGLSEEQLDGLRVSFQKTRELYIDTFGAEFLKKLDEYHTIRAPMFYGDSAFLGLALNRDLMTIVGRLIKGKFILNQQNCLINPPNKDYNQGAWHRDLPYQHFVSSSPLAINALFCIDDFTTSNGATYVLPASHKSEEFPSPSYIKNNAIQISAKAGSFIILDCMTFHSGGFNSTPIERRAINHVFTIPYFKQQINIPANLNPENLDDIEKQILGFNYTEPKSVTDYFSTR